MVASGFQAVLGKLGRDVLRSKIAATLAGSAALQKIVRQVADMPADVLRVDRFQSRKCRSGQPYYYNMDRFRAS